MRLIDADKQLEWVDCMTPINGLGLEPVVAVETVRDLVKGAPTIDAIPVEWLKARLNKCDVLGYEDPAHCYRLVLWAWENE